MNTNDKKNTNDKYWFLELNIPVKYRTYAYEEQIKQAVDFMARLTDVYIPKISTLSIEGVLEMSRILRDTECSIKTILEELSRENELKSGEFDWECELDEGAFDEDHLPE